MTTPWRAILNLVLSNMVYTWIIIPMFFYLNIFGADQKLHLADQVYADGSSMPILNSNKLFARNGSAIRALNLYNRANYELDEEKYAEAALIYVSTFFAGR